MARIFISYAWNAGDLEEKWVRDLARGLVALGHTPIYDEYDAKDGVLLANFMIQAVNDADVVLVVCNEKYLESSKRNGSGVMFEMIHINSRIHRRGVDHRVLPLVRGGDIESSVPAGLLPLIPITSLDVSLMGGDAAHHIARHIVRLCPDLDPPSDTEFPEFDLGTQHVQPRNVGLVRLSATDRYVELRHNATAQAPKLLWNLRPVVNLSFVHRVYLACIDRLAKLGFCPTLVFYDLFATRDTDDVLDGMISRSVRKLKREYGNLGSVEHHKVSKLLASVKSDKFVGYLANTLMDDSVAAPINHGPELTARNVLDHLTTIYIERKLNVRAVCSGSYDAKNYLFSEAGGKRTMPGIPSPVILEFPTISFGNRKAIDGGASEMIYETDDEGAIKSKLQRSSETEVAIALGCIGLSDESMKSALADIDIASQEIARFVSRGTAP